MNRFTNFLTKLFIRIFFPGLARDLEQEGQFDFREKTKSAETLDTSEFIQVEDNGAEITVVSFAGMAVLYAGMPRFEFRKVLQDERRPYNYIFVRDVHRACYYMAPDGSPDGTAFYAKLIGDALGKLGAKHNVAIGASGGGAAAFCIGSSLPIDHIITFNPAFPLEDYQCARSQWHAWTDFRTLVREPGAWFEGVLVLLSVVLLWRRVCRLIGRENVPDIEARYAGHKPDPIPATVFYGARNRADAAQAQRLAAMPSVTAVPTDSARHNSMLDLKLSGQLSTVIHDAIEAGFTKSQAATGAA